MRLLKKIRGNNLRQQENKSIEDSNKTVINGEFYYNSFIDYTIESFQNCIFKGVSFSNFTFKTCTFNNCIFENCNFENCNVEIRVILKFYQCDFNKVNFRECILRNLNIEETKLLKVQFEDTFMVGSIFSGNSYEEVIFKNNCNLMDASIKDNYRRFDISFINEKAYTKLSYGTHVGKFNYKKFSDRLKEDQDIKLLNLGISNTYMDLGSQFLRNNVSGKYGLCFYEGKRAYHRTLQGTRKILSNIYDVVCGYGEKPSRTFLLSLALVLFFGVLYMVAGLKTFSNEVLSLSTLGGTLSRSEFLKLFIYSIYFSTVTFATVGYGDIMVVNSAGMVISIFEIITGVFMIGVWTSTLVRKMTR